ncbi:Sugar or nucleoside kinase, ribokinase family [Devosia lucknowensis]|uniref:Sugar or nucleoside kinase, ribokinase family n=1 Tax=Devosia lucknowensis TaxID=1096929 RepID=A0A1Y6G7T3_9HYPH|nr:PfkB family carbohydrate kinase [Devosia lucknowensis]SMQ86221.1 Sugar or nucleoside kinase, ribokinase family [Devosia lucknowensis]
MSARVLVVGDVMTDIIVRPEGPMVPGSDRRAEIRNRPGGSGANQAVWLGAAGADVLFAARVGATDRAMYENYFRGLGVVPVLAGDRDLPSGVLVTLLDPGGERSFLTDRGANLNLGPEDLPETLLDGVGLVLVSGYSFFASGPRRAVQGLLRSARARHIPIAIDPASIGFLEEVGPQMFRDWVGPADWIFANEGEAELLTAEADFDGQMRSLGEQFKHVVIKRGRFGAAVGGRDGVSHSQPAPIVSVVDTTGAGDAFAASFVAALLRGVQHGSCLAAGIEGGARAVQFIGGQPQQG